jgi:DDE superfamily endonuclease
MTKRKIEYWVIPPKADAEFAASMERVLDVYVRPYDLLYPVLCMDEQPIQLLKETRVPIAGTKAHPRRVDYEYERAGTASIFMFCEPLSGWRFVSVRERRTKVDWAQEMEQLLRTRYASAAKVILVCDNLNTHTRGRLLRNFRTGESKIAGPGLGVLPHTQTWQLVEHRRERTEFDDPAMCHGPSLCDDQRTSRRDHRLA